MRKPADVISICYSVLFLFIIGCGGTALQGHKQALENITEDEYVIPKKPVDRHYIGYAWSRQFGPVADQGQPDLRVKKDRSFNSIQQDFAYHVGFGLGGQIMFGPQALAGVDKASLDKAKLEGVEIITPVSIADIPFEPNIPYITEALRLRNFGLKGEKSSGGKIGGASNIGIGSAAAVAEVEKKERKSTEGDGLVVAYKLHAIDPSNYSKNDHGTMPLAFGRILEIPGSNVYVKSYLQVIEAGSKRSLPRNVLWSCPRADAKSRDAVAAWIVEIKSTNPRRPALYVAFPAFPKIEECYNYSNTIYSRIDPITSNIIRQKINISVLEAEVSDNMRPTAWACRVSLVDETFKIKLIKESDLK